MEETRSLSRIWLGYGIVMIEILGVLFNILIFYIIRKQNYKYLDMVLVKLIAACDSIPLLFKIAVFIYSETQGRHFLKTDLIYGQIEGYIVSFFMATSITFVGCLALVRYWVIRLDRQINCKKWLIILSLQAVSFSIVLMFAAAEFGFELMPMGNYFYLKRFSQRIATNLGISYIIIITMLSSITVVFCYYHLMNQYSRNLFNHVPEPGAYGHEQMLSKTKKRSLIIKMKVVTTLILYTAAIFPHNIILLKELITSTRRSVVEDIIVVISIVSLPFLNPFTLLFLHDDSFHHLRQIFLLKK